MKRNTMTRTDWDAVLSGGRETAKGPAPAPGKPDRPEDRAEAAAIERILGETDAVRSEIRAAAASVNWDALPAVIADRALAGSEKARRPAWPAVFRMRPALAGLAAGLVVGAAAMYVALKAPDPRPGPTGVYHASSEFLDRAELEMARRSAVDYLEKSQYMLLDVVESGARGQMVPAAVRAERARDLLQKKKYLNAQLERFQMAKAKAICDQIEMLFLELSQIDTELPAAELGRIQAVVEERQLLLKINLVKKELQSGV